MERLTTYKTGCNREMICRYEDCDICEEYCPISQEDNCSCLKEILEKLGEYEDAEEQGLLLRLPCKVGDTVYSVVKDGLQIIELKFSLELYARRMSDFGKTVFLTKEEAERALKQMGE